MLIFFIVPKLQLGNAYTITIQNGHLSASKAHISVPNEDIGNEGQKNCTKKKKE